jgi:hypothetical protein
MPDIDISAGDWIAVAALAVSVSHLIGQIVLYSIRRRTASFEVSVQMVPTPGRTEPYEEQVVICNHGPALATRVEVGVFGPDGEAMTAPFLRDAVIKQWLEIKQDSEVQQDSQIKRIWPRQTLRLPLNLSMGTPPITEVEVKWKDKRWRSQDERFDVAAHWTT